MTRWFARASRPTGRRWSRARSAGTAGLTALALLAGAAVGLGAMAPAAAEPTALPGDQVKARQVRLVARASEPGTWGRAQARLNGDAETRFFVRGLDVSAPLSVQVIAERLDAPVQVSLHRHTWGAAQAEGSTGDTGIYRFDGRAHGDVGVRLRSSTGERVRATVLFWQGAPVPRSLAAVYAAPGTPRAAAAGMAAPPGAAAGAGWWPWVGGAGVAVLLVGLGVWLGRRPRRGAVAGLCVGVAVLAAGAGLPAPVGAQSGAKPENKPPDPFDVPAGLKPPPVTSADKDGKPGRGPKDDKGEKDAAAGSDAGPGSAAETEAENEAANEADIEPDASGGPAPDAGDYRARIEAAEAHVRDLASQVASNRAEIERLRLLLESDRDNEPDPANLPPMPLSCRPPLPAERAGDGVVRASDSRAMDEAFDAAWEQFEACQRCYQQPLADFEAQILLYEKLRSLYSDTKKYVDKVITTGDSLAKPHYLLENAWAAQKLDLKVTFAKTGQAYDAKLLEFNDKLSGILDRIGECEASVNNNPMWRRTSGLFFHQTMANSYKRPD